MPRHILILLFFSACSGRHLGGFDHFTEVCVEGQTFTQIEIGNKEWSCDTPPGDNGQLRLALQPNQILSVPLTLQIPDAVTGEWCPETGKPCLEIESGDLTLTAFEEGIATNGSYRFQLIDGSTLEGPVAAQYCEPTAPCTNQ